MARMIPSCFSEKITSGEKEVFRALATLPDSWVVMHDVRLKPEAGAQECQVDFLVLNPDQGVLCIEVKDWGWIGRRQGTWHLARSETSHSKPDEGPFAQASDACHGVTARIRQSVPSLFYNATFQWLCVFPNARIADTDRSGEHWDAWNILDQKSPGYVELKSKNWKGIAEVLASSIEKGHQVLYASGRLKDYPATPKGLTPAEVEAIIRRFKPDVRGMPDPTAEIRWRTGEAFRLVEEQKEKMEVLFEQDRLLVTGPAGTGKTVLAGLYAKQLAGMGKKVLYLCFNELLGEEMAERSRQDGYVAMRIHQLMSKVANLGLQENAGDAWFNQDLPLAALERLMEDGNPVGEFDHVIVDEVQDILCRPDVLDFLDAFIPQGIANGKWVFLGDLEDQVFYAGGNGDRSVFATSARKALEERCPRFTGHSLSHNCRNTPQVGRQAVIAAHIQSPWRGFRRAEGRPADIQLELWEGDMRGAVGHIQSLVARFISQGISRSDIAVLFLSASRMNAMAPALAQNHIRPWSSRGTFAGYETVQRFKGLEAKAVIVADADETQIAAPFENLMYTACTRATDYLGVVARRSVIESFTL